MSNLQLVILTIAVAYAVIGALLLVVLVYGRLHWSLEAMAAGRPQGGRAADFGGGDGTIIDMVREYVTPKAVIETAGGDSSTGEFRALPAGSERGAVFTPLPPRRMPPKDEQ